MSNEQAQKTYVCSIISVDLVGYSKLPVSEQIALKARFNGLLTLTLQPIAADGRIILDTGDGIVAGFLNDPEDALYVALMLLRGSESQFTQHGNGRLRIGLNLGPVRLGSDLNQHLTLVGDGVNVAQEIMGFAEPGSIVASRAFHDFAARLSGSYESLFSPMGYRTGKHVRNHELYRVHDSDDALSAVRVGVMERAGMPVHDPKAVAAAKQPAAGLPSPPRSSSDLAQFLSDPAKVGFASILLVAIAGLEGWFLWGKLQARGKATEPLVAATSAATPPASAPSAAPSGPAATPPPSAAAETRKSSPADVTPAGARKVEVPPVPEAIPASPRIENAPRRDPPRNEPAVKNLDSSLVAPAQTSSPVVTPRPKAEPNRPAEPVNDAKRPPRKPGPPPKPAQESIAPAPAVASPAPPVAQPSPVAAPMVAQPAKALEPVARAPLQFPVSAVRQGVTQGKVKARATIDAAGNVQAVEILSAYPQRLFDRALVDSLSQWKFPPGADGRRYEVEVEFNR